MRDQPEQGFAPITELAYCSNFNPSPRYRHFVSSFSSRPKRLSSRKEEKHVNDLSRTQRFMRMHANTPRKGYLQETDFAPDPTGLPRRCSHRLRSQEIYPCINPISISKIHIMRDQGCPKSLWNSRFIGSPYLPSIQEMTRE
ncbi:hypothetical protein TWF751_009412 [Orbilia oligospora]|nr:hypothetical protein TWF751_009412 [Orbilia oligospora]KAF3261255.1 hypothetical protein TWF128_003048 [Orbilia oligospora]